MAAKARDASKSVLNYRYALMPTPEQEAILSRTMFFIWAGWNRLVRFTRRAQRRINMGHAASLKRDLAKWIQSRKPVGMRAKKLRDAADSGQSARDLASADVKLVWSLRANSLLAIRWAAANVSNGKQGMVGPLWGKAWSQLCIKYTTAWKACWEGKRKPPRKQRSTGATWLQVQYQGDSPLEFPEPQGAFRENWVNLSLLFPNRLQRKDLDQLTCVRLIQHRTWPATGRVKDIKITRSSIRPGASWFVVFAVEIPVEDQRIEFPTTGLACGIDPGQKTAITLVGSDVQRPGLDCQEYGPGKPLRKALRKMRRLQRKIDRQRRANNPECFDAEGRWIRGKRARKISKRMSETLKALADAQAHAADVRTDYYQKLSNTILQTYDTVYLGNWKDPEPAAKGRLRKRRKEAFERKGAKRAKGEAARERAANQANRDNALGVFRRLLNEKAARSTTPKRVLVTAERFTTRACVKCHELEGPTGLRGLSKRTWTCPKCGFAQKRDATAAWNILQVGISAGSSPAPSEQAAGKAVKGAARKSRAVARASSRKGRKGSNRSLAREPGSVRTGTRGRRLAADSASLVGASANLMANSRQSLASGQPEPNQGVALSDSREGEGENILSHGSARAGPEKGS